MHIPRSCIWASILQMFCPSVCRSGYKRQKSFATMDVVILVFIISRVGISVLQHMKKYAEIWLTKCKKYQLFGDWFGRSFLEFDKVSNPLIARPLSGRPLTLHNIELGLFWDQGIPRSTRNTVLILDLSQEYLYVNPQISTLVFHMNFNTNI